MPPWLVKKYAPSEQIHELKSLLRGAGLNTVCESARCPNLGECFSRQRATFMIMGSVCTRSCGFCAVDKDKSPAPLDLTEPRRVARVSRQLGLDHVVITSVSRDDLPDGGAGHFAATIRAVRELLPQALVEALTPDFTGDRRAIARVVEAEPDIFNHNIETVPALYSQVRPQADYQRSLQLLATVKQLANIKTKSGLMLGLGENKEQVLQVMQDLRQIDCDLLTIGQYLQARKENLPVQRFVPPEEFEYYNRVGQEMGFRRVLSQPFARSSYQASEITHYNQGRRLWILDG